MSALPAPSLPRLPVFGWHAFSGPRGAGLPCLLDRPNRYYTTSGRAAILLAMTHLGVRPGVGVLLPSYHCPTMVAPATHLGGRPVFYPIDEQGAPDLAWLARQPLGDVRLMLVPHYFGLPQPMSGVRDWCDQHGIALIEDCAHALFGQAGDRPIGAWGDLAIGSLTKFLPVPEGGCLVFNRPGQPEAIGPARVTDHVRAALDIIELGAERGELRGLNTLVRGSLTAMRQLRGVTQAGADRGTGASRLDEVVIGADASGADLHIDAALARRQPAAPCRWLADHLPRHRIVQRRRDHHAWWLQRLTGHTGFRPLRTELPAGSAPYVFPLWVDQPDPGYLELRRLGLPVFRWDRRWPGQPQLEGDHGARWSHHVLQLACHQDLGAAELAHFADVLIALYAGPD